MSEFCQFTGIEHLTSADIERIALEEGGRVPTRSTTLGGPIGVQTIPYAPEWGTIVINTQGRADLGDIVLRGLTPRTKALLRQGKIRRLVNAGVDEVVAEVAVSMKYGNELAVAEVAELAMEAARQKGPYRGNSHASFDSWLGESVMLSFPRKAAAAAIGAKALRSQIAKYTNS